MQRGEVAAPEEEKETPARDVKEYDWFGGYATKKRSRKRDQEEEIAPP